ncbi:hypothetical protein WJX81_001148 [Elliptochloris bilobata]|uniref:DUF565 domain-containing protein n=1 Tax=Elliptochloris bilobata TaxID=381761 RepID=A0AAW1R0I6_9CHLO
MPLSAPRAPRGVARQRRICVNARRRSRLAARITTIPRRIEFYFADNLPRRAVWGAIAFFAGFYAANTVSLSFGALAINDVVAAAVTVAFCELCSSAFYGAARKTVKLLVVNCFKLGVIAALISDAFKLGG